MMSQNNNDHLFSLSNQLVDLFVTDILAKNNVETSKLKDHLTQEQKEKLKETVEQLQIQVSDFLEKQTSVKSPDLEQSPSESPLRSMFKKNKNDE